MLGYWVCSRFVSWKLTETLNVDNVIVSMEQSDKGMFVREINGIWNYCGNQQHVKARDRSGQNAQQDAIQTIKSKFS